MIELIHINWPARNTYADVQRDYIDDRHNAGLRFRLVVTISYGISIMDVVKWWEDYIGPADMLQSVEVIP